MEIHAIGIDLGKTFFTWWVSIHAGPWWYERGVRARSYLCPAPRGMYLCPGPKLAGA